MEKKQQDSAEKFWDSVSKRTAKSPALNTIVQKGEVYFNPDDVVLDFGCGSGDITLAIAQRVRMIYGIDTSQGMIEVANRKVKEQNCSNITFFKTDLFDEQFRNESFDIISTFNVLHYIPDKKALFGRIYELLNPNGMFISSTACLKERKSAVRFLMSGLTTLKIVPKMLFYKTSELEDEIEEAGFTIIEAINIAKFPERFIIAQKNEESPLK